MFPETEFANILLFVPLDYENQVDRGNTFMFVKHFIPYTIVVLCIAYGHYAYVVTRSIFF